MSSPKIFWLWPPNPILKTLCAVLMSKLVRESPVVLSFLMRPHNRRQTSGWPSPTEMCLRTCFLPLKPNIFATAKISGITLFKNWRTNSFRKTCEPTHRWKISKKRWTNLSYWLKPTQLETTYTSSAFLAMASMTAASSIFPPLTTIMKPSFILLCL